MAWRLKSTYFFQLWFSSWPCHDTNSWPIEHTFFETRPGGQSARNDPEIVYFKKFWSCLTVYLCESIILARLDSSLSWLSLLSARRQMTLSVWPLNTLIAWNLKRASNIKSGNVNKSLQTFCGERLIKRSELHWQLPNPPPQLYRQYLRLWNFFW